MTNLQNNQKFTGRTILGQTYTYPLNYVTGFEIKYYEKENIHELTIFGLDDNMFRIKLGVHQFEPHVIERRNYDE